MLSLFHLQSCPHFPYQVVKTYCSIQCSPWWDGTYCDISSGYTLPYIAHARIQKDLPGGPPWQRFFFFFFWGGGGLLVKKKGFKYHYKRAIFGTPAKRHLNGVSLVCRWWPNMECMLGSFVIFLGIWTSSAKEPDIFCNFSGGPDPLSPSLDPRML